MVSTGNTQPHALRSFLKQQLNKDKTPVDELDRKLDEVVCWIAKTISQTKISRLYVMNVESVRYSGKEVR